MAVISCLCVDAYYSVMWGVAACLMPASSNRWRQDAGLNRVVTRSACLSEVTVGAGYF